MPWKPPIIPRPPLRCFGGFVRQLCVSAVISNTVIKAHFRFEINMRSSLTSTDSSTEFTTSPQTHPSGGIWQSHLIALNQGKSRNRLGVCAVINLAPCQHSPPPIRPSFSSPCRRHNLVSPSRRGGSHTTGTWRKRRKRNSVWSSL
jgi:hypothetical protein